MTGAEPLKAGDMVWIVDPVAAGVWPPHPTTPLRIEWIEHGGALLPGWGWFDLNHLRHAEPEDAVKALESQGYAPVAPGEGSSHCWQDGPRIELEVPEAGNAEVGSTCMLPDGHGGNHEFTRDDQIIVAFAPPRAATIVEMGL